MSRSELVQAERRLHDRVADEAVRLRNRVVDANGDFVLDEEGDFIIDEAGRAELWSRWRAFIEAFAARGDDLSHLPPEERAEARDARVLEADALAKEISEKMTGDMLAMQIWGYFAFAEFKMMRPGLVDEVARQAEFGDGVVAFFWLNEVLLAVRDDLAARGIAAEVCYGKMSSKEIGAAKKRFLSGETPVMLCSIKKSGEGVEFTPAKRCIIAGMTPSPADMRQAESRIYRFTTDGQTYFTRCQATIGGKPTRFARALEQLNAEKIEEARRLDVHQFLEGGW